MKRIVRLLAVGVFLVIGVSVVKNKWIEYRDNTSSDRFSQPAYKKVTDIYRKILGMSSFASWHYVLANSYLDEGLEGQAAEEYKKTLQLDRRFVQAYLALANLYFQRESYGEALELLRKADPEISANPDLKDLKKRITFEYSRDAGVKAFERGDRFRARELLHDALVADPKSAQVHYLIALSLDERQDFVRVEECLKKAIELSPRFYSAYSFLGDVYFGRGDFEAAVEQYQASLAIKSADPSVLNNLGLALMNLERYGAAIPSLEQALAYDPTNIETRHNLAAVYRDYGALDKAAEGFTRIIQLKPGYPNVHNDLGDIYRRQGRGQEAVMEYRAGIEQGQERLSRGFRDPVLLVELAYAYTQIQEFDTAKKLIDEALELDPNDPKAYWTLASLYKSSNQPEAALEVLEKSKRISSKKYLFIEQALAEVKAQLAGH